MRILILTDIPPYVLGGAEQQSWLLANEWNNSGHSVSFMGHRIPKKRINGINLFHIFVIKRLGRAARAVTYFLSLSFLLLLNKKKFDIIYCRFISEAAITVCLLKKFQLIQLPIVCVPAAAGIHGNADMAIIESLPFSTFLKKTLSNQCNAINFISPGIQDSIERGGISAKYYTNIPNGVKIPSKPHYLSPQQPISFVFAGRLTKQKGLEVLITALSVLNTRGHLFKCDIIGEGEDYLLLNELANKKQISDKVHFVGRVTQENINTYLTKAHYFVLPSHYEGLSNAALEAISIGLPCILTRCNGLDTFLPSDTVLLCDPGDTNSLVESLITALSISSSEWEKTSRKLREIAREKFSIQTVAQQNIELFEKLKNLPIL